MGLGGSPALGPHPGTQAELWSALQGRVPNSDQTEPQRAGWGAIRKAPHQQRPRRASEAKQRGLEGQRREPAGESRRPAVTLESGTQHPSEGRTRGEGRKKRQKEAVQAAPHLTSTESQQVERSHGSQRPQREGCRFPRGTQRTHGRPAHEPGRALHMFHLWAVDLDSRGQPRPHVRGKVEVPQQCPSQNLLEQQGVTGEVNQLRGRNSVLRAGKGPWGRVRDGARVGSGPQSGEGSGWG